MGEGGENARSLFCQWQSIPQRLVGFEESLHRDILVVSFAFIDTLEGDCRLLTKLAS